MTRDPRIALAVCAHALMTGSALWLIWSSGLPLSMRIIVGIMAAAILLPWLQALAAKRLERLSWLALLLIFIIGAGIVEVLASGAQLRANILLGAALLEFAILISLARSRSARASSGPAQP